MGEIFLPKPEYDVIFKKVSVSVSKDLVLKKSKSEIIGVKKVSVLVSKTFGLKKSLGISLEKIW